jgi:hypothetical protein
MHHGSHFKELFGQLRSVIDLNQFLEVEGTSRCAMAIKWEQNDSGNCVAGIVSVGGFCDAERTSRQWYDGVPRGRLINGGPGAP